MRARIITTRDEATLFLKNSGEGIVNRVLVMIGTNENEGVSSDGDSFACVPVFDEVLLLLGGMHNQRFNIPCHAKLEGSPSSDSDVFNIDAMEVFKLKDQGVK